LILRSGDGSQIYAIVVMSPRRSFGKAGTIMAVRTLTAVFAHETEKRLLITAADAIDRNGKHRAAGCLRAFDQCLSNFPLGDAYS
jgi:hypothetical protein